MTWPLFSSPTMFPAGTRQSSNTSSPVGLPRQPILSSFCATLKPLNVWGDGGSIATNDDEMADFLKSYRNHGMTDRDHNERWGVNSRMQPFQAIVGAKVLYAKENNFKVSVTEIIKKVSKKTKVVFLANPNNPTGTYLKKNELLQLRKKLRSNILLVVDDAYDEYMKKNDYVSGLKLFKNSKNVILLRTFSKIYGLASLRIGWGYGPKKIIDAMNVIKPPFNTNMAAQFAAVAALKDRSFIKKSAKHNLIWANKLKKVFNKFNIITNEVTANFLLLNFNKCKYSANHVQKKLENNGIILRSMQSYKIKNALRLTIGSSVANNKLISILNKIFKK